VWGGVILALLGSWSAESGAASPEPSDAALQLKLRTRVETAKGSQRFHTLTRSESWDPRKTAVIVCDVWDLHHCLNAVRRETEFAPRLNEFLRAGRSRGVTVIHAPSDCMDAYQKHPARLRALAVTKAKNLPKDIGSWCSRIPAEESGRYPIDQSDGGEDDDPAEHKAWAAKLEGMGRNPRAPWKKESDLITIEASDYVSDKGDEIWSILAQRGIDNVILTGVHTNMCVLGRPFGLRQMVKNGKKAVLVRDLTDTMYNPARWPYVSHFTGTDLIVEHIEKFVCPTLTSDQLLGGKPFRFKNDKRPHLVMIMAEVEYDTKTTLPAFASKYLGKDFRVSMVFDRKGDPDELPGLEVLNEADVLLVSVHRRLLKPEQLRIIRRFVEAGKAVVGIRTASHAFAPRGGKVPRGHVAWPEFDLDALGGNYHGHHGNKVPRDPATRVRAAADAVRDSLLTGVRKEEFAVTSWLYKTSPLAKGARVLLMGRVGKREPAEPVAWTFSRRGGGRSFYTSLGHPDDFAKPEFQRLLLNGIYWAAGLPVPKEVPPLEQKNAYRSHWHRMTVPTGLTDEAREALRQGMGSAWYRCLVKIPREWSGRDLALWLGPWDGTAQVFMNGNRVEPIQGNRLPEKRSTAIAQVYRLTARQLEAGDLNLLALRISGGRGRRLSEAPEIRCGKDRLSLRGCWQFRLGDDPSWARYPLPARFAASTDVIFDGESFADGH
jgi:type 1 glutamine amidotransferase/nicotinamidase-related amidase